MISYIQKNIERPPHMQNLCFQLLTTPLAWIYRQVVTFRRFLYRHNILRGKLLPGVTISVGNIVVGGSGKTPFCIALAQQLIKEGSRPVILTRGYGVDLEESLVVLNGASTPIVKKIPDETMLMSQSLPETPIVVGQHRFQNAMKYINENEPPTHWILEDGMQHLQIYRDIDICLVDDVTFSCNDITLPRSRLREPISALCSSDITVATYLDSAEKASLFQQNRVPNEQSSEGSPSNHMDSWRSLTSFRDTILPKRSRSDFFSRIYLAADTDEYVPPTNIDFGVEVINANLIDPKKGSVDNIEDYSDIWAVTAIANPERFFHSLQTLTQKNFEKKSFPDHSDIPFQSFSERLKVDSLVVTTAKDFWRHAKLFLALPSRVLILELKMILPTPLIQRIKQLSSPERLNCDRARTFGNS